MFYTESILAEVIRFDMSLMAAKKSLKFCLKRKTRDSSNIQHY